MAIVRRTSKAERDLIDIGEFVARDNLSAADRLLNLIDSKCRLLATQPGIGTIREDLASRLRFFPIGHCLIFYRAIPNGIEVIRDLHGARDLEAELE